MDQIEIRNEDTKLEQRKIHLLKKPKIGLHRTFQPGWTPNLRFYRLELKFIQEDSILRTNLQM